MIEFTCTGCGAALSIGDEWAGLPMSCATCWHCVRVPTPGLPDVRARLVELLSAKPFKPFTMVTQTSRTRIVSPEQAALDLDEGSVAVEVSIPADEHGVDGVDGPLVSARRVDFEMIADLIAD